jgi:hypothetical protein
MELNDVFARPTITFPEIISFAGVEGLLIYISEHLKVDVHYSLDTPKSFIYDDNDKKSKLVLKDRVMGDILIKDRKNNSLYSVKLGSQKENSLEFSFMRFDMENGGNISNYKKETLEFWDDIRDIVNDYFKKEKLEEKNLKEE